MGKQIGFYDHLPKPSQGTVSVMARTLALSHRIVQAVESGALRDFPRPHLIGKSREGRWLVLLEFRGTRYPGLPEPEPHSVVRHTQLQGNPDRRLAPPSSTYGLDGEAIRHRTIRKAGYLVLHVCNDDHSRASYMEVLADEKKGTTVSFLQRALLHFQAQGVQVRKLLPDNGSPNCSKEFKAMRGAWAQAEPHPSLPSQNQRQGRAFGSTAITTRGPIRP